MKTINFAFFLLLILPLHSCFVDDIICENGEGPVVKTEFKLENIKSFTLRGSGKVYLTQGDTQSIIVEGQPNVLEKINTKVSANGHWNMQTRTCFSNHKELKYYITLPNIEYAKIDGSGKIYGQSQIVSDQITIKINGSGEITMELVANSVETEINGSGKINLSGTAASIDSEITGSGDMLLFGLVADNHQAKISGSGKIETTTNVLLSGNIAGSGNIRYKGEPEVNVKISGSGKVSKTY
jgi:hypothetical protein